MLDKAKKLLGGVLGLAVLGVVGHLFLAGAAPADYIGPSLGAVALFLGYNLVVSAVE